jgi:hypothetical protein
MKKIFAALLFFVGTLTFAQSSNVTATVTDSDGQSWNNGIYQIVFVPPSGYTGSIYTFNGSSWTPPSPINGSLTGSGGFTYNSLPRNDYILPSGSSWLFNFCPNASFHCSATTIVINTASQNISSSLVLVAPRFPASNFQTGSFGYADSEVSPVPPIGNGYFNVSLSNSRIWNGSSWINGAGAASGVGTIIPGTNVTCSPSPCTGATVTINSTAGGSTTFQVGGTPLASQATVNFEAGSNVTITNPSAGNIQISSSSGGINQLTGDITAGPGTGSQIGTLATVNSSPGTCGDSTHVSQVSINGKGLTTSCVPISISAGIGYPSSGLAASTGTAWRTPTFSDVVSLWASGSCSGYLKSDGTCSIPSGTGIFWQRQPSPVIVPLPTDTSQQVQEVSAVLDNSPEILTGASEVVKFTFTDGWWPSSDGGTGVGICFGENEDGISPIVRSNPCPIASTVNHGRSWLMKNPVGSGYMLYAATIPGNQIDLFTGSTVAGVTLTHANVLACGSNGGEESGQTFNSAIWYDTTQTPHWRMLYDCFNLVTSTYADWLAVSSDGITWIKNSTLPVIGEGSGVDMGGLCNNASGPWVGLENGVPHAYVHCGPGGFVPTPYIWHLKDSTGVGNAWVPDNSPAITARTTGEGVNNSSGQIADTFALDMAALNESLLYFTEYGPACSTPGICNLPSYIEVAQINQPLATVVNESATDGVATQTVPTVLINGIVQPNNQLIVVPQQYVPTPSTPSSAGLPGQWSVGAGPSGHSYFYWYDSTTSLWAQSEGSETWTPCISGYQEYSTFLGTNATPLTSYTSPCSNTYTLYANSGVTATIPELSGSGTAVLASGSYAAALSTLIPSSANYTVAATFTLTSTAISSDQALLFARTSSGSNTNYAFACAPFSGVCGLYGPSGQIGSNYTFSWGSGEHRLSMSLGGTSINCYIDGGSAVISQTNSSISGAGLTGFRITPNLSASLFTVQ